MGAATAEAPLGSTEAQIEASATAAGAQIDPFPSTAIIQKGIPSGSDVTQEGLPPRFPKSLKFPCSTFIFLLELEPESLFLQLWSVCPRQHRQGCKIICPIWSS